MLKAALKLFQELACFQIVPVLFGQSWPNFLVFGQSIDNLLHDGRVVEFVLGHRCDDLQIAKLSVLGHGFDPGILGISRNAVQQLVLEELVIDHEFGKFTQLCWSWLAAALHGLQQRGIIENELHHATECVLLAKIR